MMTPIIFVHLLQYGINEYFKQCVQMTAFYNTGNPIVVITADPRVEKEIQALGIAEIQTLLISQDMHAQHMHQIDRIIYHDGLNKRSFEVGCYVRHRLVWQLAQSEPVLQNASSFLIMDSDSALFAPLLELVDRYPAPNEVCSEIPLATNFSFWGREALETMSDLGALQSYFDYCSKTGAKRSSDMQARDWLINMGQISFKPFRRPEEGGFLHIDPARQFFSSYGLYALLSDGRYLVPSEKQNIIAGPPHGHWQDLAFLEQFVKRDFLNELFEFAVSKAGHHQIYVKRDAVRKALDRVEQAWGGVQKNAFFATMSMDMNRVPPRLPVGHIHFQGAFKRSVKKFYQFWSQPALSEMA